MACCLANVSQGWVNVHSTAPLGHHGDPGDPTDRGMGRRGLRRESVESLGCIRGASRAGCLLQRRPALTSPATRSPREKWPWGPCLWPCGGTAASLHLLQSDKLSSRSSLVTYRGKGAKLGKAPSTWDNVLTSGLSEGFEWEGPEQ